MVKVNITFRDVTPCSLVDNCQRFRLAARSIFMVVTVCCQHVTDFDEMRCVGCPCPQTKNVIDT